ncbi:MAG: translation elongation factor 4 [bacterium]|nr:translation elongation factor 4 [bacterium]
MKEAIRNFCIIAHIDHGKSTLADRLLEITETVPEREMQDQLLDQMELERERGITIKLQPVTLRYRSASNEMFTLHLIDTPGHVDFSYEVSRTLAAVEGAILLVDATQGIEAQTLSHLYLAVEEDLTIIPVINKIDLPNANPDRVAADLEKLLGVKKEEIIAISAKTGLNVDQVLERVVSQVPPPRGKADQPLRALVFDSVYDSYRGVVAYIRVVDGSLKAGERIKFIKTGQSTEVQEVGWFTPALKAGERLTAGMIGYIVTGLKEIGHSRVGDTLTAEKNEGIDPLPGYKTIKPMVFAGLYAKEGDEYPKLRDAIEKLKLNDASLVYEAEHFPALGFGFRAGFLGLLHLEIVQARLEREYDVDLVVTSPSVAYRVRERGKQEMSAIHSPLELPDPGTIEAIEEPWLKVDIVSPAEYVGPIMKLVQENHGIQKSLEYLDPERVILQTEIPLAGVVIDFYDRLKNVTRGYASLNYEFLEYREADLVKLDILIADQPEEPLAQIVRRDDAYSHGRRAVENLAEVLPRQQFEVKIQAAISGKVIASSRLAPLRKDVTAKLYGGDVTRKRKLLEKQKRGKKRLRAMGQVEIPPNAYLSLLKKR